MPRGGGEKNRGMLVKGYKLCTSVTSTQRHVTGLLQPWVVGANLKTGIKIQEHDSLWSPNQMRKSVSLDSEKLLMGWFLLACGK